MDEDSAILDTIRDSFGRVVYTHKTHEKQLEILHGRLERYKWARLIIIALTATGALGVLLVNDRAVEVVTAILAFISLAVTLYGMSFNPEKQMSDHRRTARELWHIRECYLNLISDLVANRVDEDEAAQHRDRLTEELAEIYEDSPDTTSEAYLKAQKALKVSEEMTFSDAEIDAFLPKSLRKDFQLSMAVEE